MLFGDLAKQDFAEAWNGKFVAFCFVVTLVSISLVALMSMALKDKSQRGEFIQGAYRSSAAILGIAFITNIYGNSGMAPLMIIGSVPLYNIMAVIVLSFTKPGQNGMSPELIKKTLKGIATNPIILGILAGALWSVLRLPMPTILTKTVSSLGGLTTPLGLMAMGAAFNWSEAKSGMGPGIRGKLHEADRSVYALSSGGGASGLSRGRADRNFGHAGFQHHRQQLRYGPEYGTQRCFKLQHCGNHHTGKRVFPDILAVCVKDSGTDLNRSGISSRL